MRVIPLLLASLVIAGGCKKKDTGETDTGDTEDSGDSGGEDSGDTGDSGDSGDTDTGTEPLYRIFDFHYETEEDIPDQWRLALRLAWFDDDAPPEILREYQGVPMVNTPVALPIPTCKEPDWGPMLDGVSEGCYFIPYVYVDANFDEDQDDNEQIQLITNVVVIYIGRTDGVDVHDWAAIQVEVGNPTAYTDFYIDDDIPLVDVISQDSVTIGGSADLGSDPKPERMTTWSVFEEGGLLPNRPFDDVIPDINSWTRTIDQPLDAGRVLQPDDITFTVGVEVPIGYQDTGSSSGAFDVDDSVVSHVCSGAEQVQLIYLPPPLEAWPTFSVYTYGLHHGWQAVVGAEEGLPTPLTESEATSLEWGAVDCL